MPLKVLGNMRLSFRLESTSQNALSLNVNTALQPECTVLLVFTDSLELASRNCKIFKRINDD